MRQCFHALQKFARCVRFLETRDKIGQRAVVDAPTELRSRNRQADREMCLADARWAEKYDVLFAFNEADLGETLDLLSLHGGLKAEVEIGKHLYRGQPAAAHRGLQAPVVAQADLGVEHCRNRIAGTELTSIDPGEHMVERFEGAGHL